MKALQRRVVGPSGCENEGSIQNIEEWKKDGEPHVLLNSWSRKLQSNHITMLFSYHSWELIEKFRKKCTNLSGRAPLKNTSMWKLQTISVHQCWCLPKKLSQKCEFFSISFYSPVCWHHLGFPPPICNLTPPVQTHMKESVAFLLGRAPETPGEPSGAVLEGCPGTSWDVPPSTGWMEVQQYGRECWNGVSKFTLSLGVMFRSFLQIFKYIL